MTRFGVNWPIGIDNSGTHAKSIHNLGCKEVRIPLSWRTVEHEQGHYNWEWFDRTVETVRGAGLGFLPIVYQTPSWMAANEKAPPDPAAYGEFCVEVLKHYGCPAVEVWNEPNWRYSADQALDWDGSFEQYADCYRAARAAVNAHDPAKDAILGGLAYVTGWMGAVSGTPSDFLGWIWNRLGPVDAVGLHPYGFPPDPVADSMAKIRQLVSFLNSKGSVAPIDVTEIGMEVPPQSEKQRAAYLKQMATKIQGWKRVRRFTVYMWVYHDPPWSICNPNGSWRGGASGYSQGIKS